MQEYSLHAELCVPRTNADVNFIFLKVCTFSLLRHAKFIITFHTEI